MLSMCHAVGLQGQVLFPLSHVASLVANKNTGRTNRSAKNCQRHGKQDPQSDVLCSESFCNVLSWLSKSSLQDLARLSLTEIQFKHLALSSIGTRRGQHRPSWHVSGCSADTFFENKNGFTRQQLRRSVPVLSCLFLGTGTSLYRFASLLEARPLYTPYQIRGFKTRSRQVGDVHSALVMKAPDLNERFLALKTRKDKDKQKVHSEAEHNERLKTLLSDENLTQEEQQRLRVAFAEGYMACDPKARTSTKLRVFNIFRDLLGIILILAILFSFMGELSGGPFRRVLIGTTNEVMPEDIDVTFDDVKGVDEAKQELQEIVEFLRNPEKFSSLGGKLPKGVLLVGPPGTGKTLLARAVAGEANVPFFHAAGPEFDEILVGQGARRVRDLFSTAKMRAPCVVFIDEIDSVGAKRTNSVLHPYANQTINQLLTEMDGFRQNEGVIVLGATNRRDDLDKALLRPGRFDVEVQVPVPDLAGRKEILQLYLGKVKVASDVSLDVLARGTTGFTGADLENVVNQAALRAAIDAAPAVSMRYLESARDKVLMGPERKSRIPDEEANLITAYHEGGHALVAHYSKEAHPLHKVTIIPRGPSLGHTAYIPEKEHYHVTKAQMMATMDTLMGGRAAEELVFGSEKITSGASSDLKQATALATNMVKEWGMSEKVGVRTFDEDHSSLIVVNELAPNTAEVIDSEIKRLLHESYERAKAILKTHQKEHKLLAEALLKYETLDADDVKQLLSGKDLSQIRKSAQNAWDLKKEELDLFLPVTFFS
ncbi:ATP-dependent zinc metalloprotease YME1L isoform X3 [Dermacentor albipictus]|uniref:ATP-dependent zinc metalloprotease YME1L isoform X3 n=1 Tax=Dermacentor albipictus TaxID=60249 RepID=UPI0031FBDD84